MIPVNGKTSPCTPISSNCVVWQGPDLPCIDLCNGDTVSDVIAALATKLCDFIDLPCQCDPDLTGLDLKCALPDTPPTDLVETLQAIVDFFCEEIEKSISIPNLPVPECLQETVNNVLITELPLVDWAILIGNQICIIIDAVTTLNQNILNLESRIAVLEECVLPCTPSQASDFDVVSSCIQPGELIPISTLLLALETEFCNLRDVLGTVALINNAISAQCLFSTSDQLSSNGTLGNVQGWVDNPSTLAESNVNQWLAICDIYTAVQSIQENCCPVACELFTVGYTYTVNQTPQGIASSIVLNFISSNVPPGFSDCGGSSLVTLTDSAGSQITQNINITSLSTSSSGVLISLGSLIATQPIMVTVEACVTDGSSECSDTSSVSVPLSLSCPDPITAIASPTGEINVSFSNVFGPSVTYIIIVKNTATFVQLGTATIVSPGATINETFTGGVPGSEYQILLTIQQNESVVSCDPILVTIPGISCADQTPALITDATTFSTVDQVYIGIAGDAFVGPGATQYFYSPSSNQIIETTGYLETLSAPILSNYSVSNPAVGEVTLDIAYGPAAGASVETSYSADGVTWTAWVAASIGANVLTTAFTSGAIYIRAKAIDGVDSLYSIIRYDYSTDSWTVIQSPSECPTNPLGPLVCPAGVQVAQQYLDCGTNTYNTIGVPFDSYWYFIGKTFIGGITRYLYAGWNQAGLSTVVECCVCPAFLMTDVIRVFCGQDGDSVNFSVPYVLGESNPRVTVVTSPVLGTLVQSSTYSNQFTYTTFGPGLATGDYADTVTLELQPEVAGDCTSMQATVQIQLIPCTTGMEYVDQAVYIFINTNDFTPTEGEQIREGLIALRNAYNAEWGYAGQFYYVPTTDRNWLGYQKAIVDNGTSWNQSVDPLWNALEYVPSTWGGTGATVSKAATLAIILSNSSDGVYHDATLASGFGSGLTAQPTNQYKDDYECLNDALNGTQVSTWAQGLGLVAPVYTDKFTLINYAMHVSTPTPSVGADAANILQMLASYVGELIVPSKYGVKTAVDVTPYLLAGAPSNPYQGATTAAATPMNPLYEISDGSVIAPAGVLALLDQDKNSDNFAEIEAGTNDEFNTLLSYGIKGCDSAYPDKTDIGKYIRNTVEIDPCDAAAPNVFLLWDTISPPQNGKVYLVETFSGDKYCGTIIDNNAGVVPTDWSVDTQLQTSCSPAECITYEVLTCNNALGLGQHTFFVKLDAAGALTNGDIWKIDNTSGTFSPGGGRPDWPLGIQVCVEIVNNNIDRNVQDHEFEAATVVGGPYPDCISCP